MGIFVAMRSFNQRGSRSRSDGICSGTVEGLSTINDNRLIAWLSFGSMSRLRKWRMVRTLLRLGSNSNITAFASRTAASTTNKSSICTDMCNAPAIDCKFLPLMPV